MAAAYLLARIFYSILVFVTFFEFVISISNWVSDLSYLLDHIFITNFYDQSRTLELIFLSFFLLIIFFCNKKVNLFKRQHNFYKKKKTNFYLCNKMPVKGNNNARKLNRKRFNFYIFYHNILYHTAIIMNLYTLLHILYIIHVRVCL